MILALVVHPANIQDRDGAKLVLEKLKTQGPFSRLKRIWADSGYAGEPISWVKQFGPWTLEIVKKPAAGFAVLPKRWIVERTLSWLGKYRRLSKDYETLTASSESMILISAINFMLHRLKPG
jgi:putative transposase